MFNGSRIPGDGEAVTVPVCLAVAAAPATRRNFVFGQSKDEQGWVRQLGLR